MTENIWTFKFTEVSTGILKCIGKRNTGHQVEKTCKEEDRFHLLINAYQLEQKITSVRSKSL